MCSCYSWFLEHIIDNNKLLYHFLFNRNIWPSLLYAWASHLSTSRVTFGLILSDFADFFTPPLFLCHLVDAGSCLPYYLCGYSHNRLVRIYKANLFYLRFYTAVSGVKSGSAKYNWLFYTLTDLSELDEIGQLRLSHCTPSPKSSSPEPPKEKQQRVDLGDPADGEKADMAMMAYLHDLWKSLADRENYPLPHHVGVTSHFFTISPGRSPRLRNKRSWWRAWRASWTVYTIPVSSRWPDPWRTVTHRRNK